MLRRASALLTLLLVLATAGSARAADPPYILVDVSSGQVLAERQSGELWYSGVAGQADDRLFGTGHSSLGRLPSLAFDTLKIDRSIVAGLDANEDNRAIIRLIVSLAGTLGMEIVTEGVEREEEYLLLREDGIQHVQGFLWCPALPFSEFSELVGALQPSSAGRAEGKTAAG